jgi:hypothetical protein
MKTKKRKQGSLMMLKSFFGVLRIDLHPKPTQLGPSPRIVAPPIPLRPDEAPFKDLTNMSC